MDISRAVVRRFKAVFVFFVLVLLWTTPVVAQPVADSSAVLIRDVRLVDFTDEGTRIRDAMNVLVRDGRIAAVSGDAAAVDDDDARVVDGQGGTLVPGLVDMHVHIWDEAELGAYLASGVTTVRNLSGMPLHARLADRIVQGELDGPRIITSGPILNSPGPNAQLNHVLVGTADAARVAVRAQYEAGYRRVKVYSNLNRDAYEAIRDEAARLGMTITGHTPEGPREAGMPYERPFHIGFEELLDDGFETIEHVESIVWHGLRDRYDPKAARALAARIAEADVAVDPTLIAFANLQRIAATQGAHLQRPGTETLNPFIQSMETAQSERWSGEDVGRAAEQLEFFVLFTRMLDDAGVMLLTGSDAGIATNIPGVSLHDELDLFEDAGLDRETILRAATANAARALGEVDVFGRIEPGQRADLLLVAGNPFGDLGLLRRPVAVIAGGRFYDADVLASLRDTATRTDPERTQRNAREALEAQGSPLPGS
ncbi:MAG: amidohydrolase family protein [Parasphingopyxis sp.]|uniref:amidohydrolase family protein n=1 Tax=Parasphingopyxis sp. TaxID=1920299 RepID=UPI0032F063F2